MRRARFLAPWKDREGKPVFYHCISRVVERRFAFGPEEKEKFRTFMRMIEKFSGCRVVSYCLMCNHIHLLLEVPPMPEAGLSDAELLERLHALYSEAFVAEVAKELAAARAPEVVDPERRVAEIHARFTYRMHDLGQFMKALLQRFSQWFNRTHNRSGTLWEDRYKSVIVEDGVAAKTMAAYIDLNPVRAGIVEDPADYRWSSYGEAMGGRKKARAGLVRALRAHQGQAADPSLWREVSREYRRLLMEGSVEKVRESVGRDGKPQLTTVRKGISKEKAVRVAGRSEADDGLLFLGRSLRHRIRYFTDGAVIGSRLFVDEVFRGARERFGPRRKNGARRLRGAAAALAGEVWSLRDLRADGQLRGETGA
jgi:putative transposase